jgi:hypothetical protein
MSNEERVRILRMVSEGKLTAEQALGLLEALEPARRSDSPRPPMPEPPSPPRSAGRALVIQVSEGGVNRVNLRIPFGLARAAGRFIPRQARDRLHEHGIDLDEFLTDMGPSDQGVLLHVQDENDQVLISVE